MTRRHTLGLGLALAGLLTAEYWACWQVLHDRPIPWPAAGALMLAAAGVLIVRSRT